jgi:lysophospholipase L1-like esterase
MWPSFAVDRVPAKGYDPRIMTLMSGLNDFHHDETTPEKVRDNILILLRNMARKHPNALIFLAQIPPYYTPGGSEDAGTQRRNAQIRETNLLLRELAVKAHFYADMNIHQELIPTYEALTRAVGNREFPGLNCYNVGGEVANCFKGADGFHYSTTGAEEIARAFQKTITDRLW